MMPKPLSIIFFQASHTDRQASSQLDDLIASVRPSDEVIYAFSGGSVAPGKAQVTKHARAKIRSGDTISDALYKAIECASHEQILVLSPRVFCTRYFLDRVRTSAQTYLGAVICPRSSTLPGYQGVTGIGYQGRSEFRAAEREWSETHYGLYSSSPFLASDAFWAKKDLLTKLFLEMDKVNDQVDLAWELSEEASTSITSILVDDSVLVHLETPINYHLCLEYGRGSLSAAAKYTKWAKRNDGKTKVIQATGATQTEVLGLAMIVKNEEDSLSHALESVSSLVETMNVLDTGSSDQTVAIAAEKGAIVGYFEWTDDFGKARQIAQDNCLSDWVIAIDADEVLEVDYDKIFDELANAVGTNSGFTIEITNEDKYGVGTSVRNQMARLLRRVDTCWRGQIHEQVFSRSRYMTLAGTISQSVRIIHYGYSNETMLSKSKVDRNLNLAKTFCSREGTMEAKIHLSRSLVLAGQVEESIELMSQVALDKKLDPAWLPVVYRHLIDNCLGIGRIDDAKQWHIEFKTRFPDRADQQVREMLILCKMQRIDDAMGIYKSLPVQENYIGDIQFSKSFYVQHLVDALESAKLYLEAVAVILTSLKETEFLDVHPGRVITLLNKAGVSALEFYNRIPEKRKVTMFGLILQLGRVEPDSASAFLLSLWRSGVQNDLVLACAENFVASCGLSQILEWAVIFRSIGANDRCPLNTAGRNQANPVQRRVALLYMGWVSFSDQDALAGLTNLLESLEQNDRADLERTLLTEFGFDLTPIYDRVIG